VWAFGNIGGIAVVACLAIAPFTLAGPATYDGLGQPSHVIDSAPTASAAPRKSTYYAAYRASAEAEPVSVAPSSGDPPSSRVPHPLIDRTSSSTATVAPTPQYNGYYVAPNGNDAWTGRLAAPSGANTDGPFRTLGRAQQAMRGSALKTVYIRAGTYFPAPDPDTVNGGCLYGQSDSISLRIADRGETWSYYPPDGYNSAIIDGSALIAQTGQGDSTTGTGTGCAFGVHRASNVTIDGLQFQNYRLASLWTYTGSNLTFTNNIVHDTRVAAFGADAVSLNCAPNSKVSNNYIYNTAYIGIGLGNGDCPGGMNGDVIENNVIINSCTWASDPGGDEDGGDCGAIYGEGTNSTGIQITNNYIRDVNVSSNGAGDFGECCAIGIYMDGASNFTATGNIISGITSACFQIHGDNNHVTGNICHESHVGPQRIAIYYTTDSANGIRATGNTFQNNIVIGGTKGGGGGFRGHTLAGTPAPLSIKNNIYFNYAGSSMNSGGGTSAGDDSSPVHADPQISCWSVNIARGSPAFRAPVSFPAIKGGWGPPGFVIPRNGTAPSWPHGC
jgi:hypothetical protein